MGNGIARFSINALGSTFTTETSAMVNEYLNRIALEINEHQTGETFINFMEVAPSLARVRSAYTPDDWEKLVAIKTKYDPKNIFRFNRNIPPLDT
jgi:FAD/FMN-containing dehydrogenase